MLFYKIFDLFGKNWTLFSDLKAILAVGFIKKEKGPKSLNKVQFLPNKSKNLIKQHQYGIIQEIF